MTLLAVAVLAALAVAGYVGFERYERLVTRADRAEDRASDAQARASLAERRFRDQQVPEDRLRAEYERGFSAGTEAGANDIIGFIEEPGFYIAEVKEDAEYPVSIAFGDRDGDVSAVPRRQQRQCRP